MMKYWTMLILILKYQKQNFEFHFDLIFILIFIWWFFFVFVLIFILIWRMFHVDFLLYSSKRVAWLSIKMRKMKLFAFLSHFTNFFKMWFLSNYKDKYIINIKFFVIIDWVHIVWLKFLMIFFEKKKTNKQNLLVHHWKFLHPSLQILFQWLYHQALQPIFFFHNILF